MSRKSKCKHCKRDKLKAVEKVQTKEYDEGNPTEYLIESIKKAEQGLKEGRVSPVFDNTKDAIKWVTDDHSKFQNGECVCGKKHEGEK